MVDNLGQRAADYADFQSGFRRARSERYALQQQRMQTEEMRRRVEAAQRQAELEAQRGGARAGMLTPPPSFDTQTVTPMPVDRTPTAGLRADGSPAAVVSPADMREPDIRAEPLEDADSPPMTDAAQLRSDLQEAYRLLDLRRERGVDVTGTEDRIAILEQRLEEAVQSERVVGDGAAPPEERGIGEREERGRMPSIEVPEDIMQEAEAYDNAGTPYDSLIQQAATQYGIDPVIFKRLIGTESSFDPNAVSPSGKDAGLGMAQIAAVHGLSDEERLSPAVAIPAGAEIFADMLRQSGGDYAEAIMRYKGASSEQGRANMQRPLQIILAGTEYYPGAGGEGQAASPQRRSQITQAQQEAQQESEDLTSETREQAGLTAQDDVITDPASDRATQTYSTGTQAPQRVGIDTQRLLRTREGLVQLARINAQAGTTEGNDKFDALYTQIQEIDTKLQYLQGMQGVNEFRMQNNPSRLAAVWGSYAGMDIQIQNRTDGTYNIYIEGELAQEGVDQEQIINSAKQAFSQEYREALSAIQAEERELELAIRKMTAETALETQKDLSTGVDVIAETQTTDGQTILTIRNQQGQIEHRVYQSGQEGSPPGMFSSGQPLVPPAMVPVQGTPLGTSLGTPLGATGGGANFNPDLLVNWNN